MSTATEQMMKRDEAEFRKMAFEHMVEAFSKQYRPSDRYDAAQFEAQLMSIVRQVYTDAQAPLLDTITKIALATPSPLAMYSPKPNP